MRAAFSISGATRHGAIALAEGLIVAGIIAALLLALSPIYAPARLISGTDQTYAAKGGNSGGGGSLSATISMDDGARLATASSDMTFTVTRSIPDNDPVMWVTTKCYDASGTQVSWLDLPVIWGTWDSLEGYAGAYPVSGSWCEAYATLRPWQSRVLGDAYVRFDVGG